MSRRRQRKGWYVVFKSVYMSVRICIWWSFPFLFIFKYSEHLFSPIFSKHLCYRSILITSTSILLFFFLFLFVILISFFFFNSIFFFFFHVSSSTHKSYNRFSLFFYLKFCSMIFSSKIVLAKIDVRG